MAQQHASLDRPVTLSCKNQKFPRRSPGITFLDQQKPRAHDRSAYAKRATDLENTHAFRAKLTNALFNGGLLAGDDQA
jgi:hypothetical protein